MNLLTVLALTVLIGAIICIGAGVDCAIRHYKLSKQKRNANEKL